MGIHPPRSVVLFLLIGLRKKIRRLDVRDIPFWIHQFVAESLKPGDSIFFGGGLARA